MARIIAALVTWLAGKVAIYAVILALLLGIFVAKVVPPMVVRYHEKELGKAIAELSESRALVGDLAERAQDIGAEIGAKKRQLDEINRRRDELGKMFNKIWNNIFNRGELAAEKTRLDKQQERLDNEILQAREKLRLLEIEGGETEEELKRRELLRDEKERQLSEIHGMRAAFDSLMRNELRELAFHALLILAALILIPLLWKVLAFYVIAPIAHSSQPILLGADVSGMGEITFTGSQPAQRISLGEGEVMVTKVDYLQGSMGNFEKRTQWLMDWHYPFSSIAAGLHILTRIRNTGGGDGQVTLSPHENATEELAVIGVPEGKAMVIRPHYLVAVTHPLGKPPRIRSRWVFGKLHAWVNLQFRHLLVEGPARLVFSAQRGVQVEEVLPSLPGRRVNRNLTAAFSPHLNYSPKRAETFVAYLRGKNSLFDDFFQGSGHVIQQQATGGKTNPAARIWQGVFGAVGKVFGI